MTYKEALRYCQSVYGYRLNMFMFLQQGKHPLGPLLLSANLPFKNSTKMPPHLTRSVIMSNNGGLVLCLALGPMAEARM